MKPFRSANPNALFIVFIIIYLYARQWPFGDILQTAGDILVAFAVVFMLFRFFVKKK